MNIGSSVSPSATSGANSQNDYSIAIAKKALDATKAQGDEAVSLIDSAGNDSATVGKNLDTKA